MSATANVSGEGTHCAAPTVGLVGTLVGTLDMSRAPRTHRPAPHPHGPAESGAPAVRQVGGSTALHDARKTARLREAMDEARALLGEEGT